MGMARRSAFLRLLLTAVSLLPAVALGSLRPLWFEPVDASRGSFLARGARYQVLVRPGLIEVGLTPTTSADRHGVTIGLVGAAKGGELHPESPLAVRSSAFIGRDPLAWRWDIPTYGRLTQRGAWPGIDVVYYGRDGELEYDLQVAPEADPGQFALAASAGTWHVAEGGAAMLTGDGVGLRLHPPVAWQDLPTGRRAVTAQWQVRGDGTLGLRVGAYDRHQPLTIDPVLTYSSYIAGSMSERPGFVARDALGNVWVAGNTNSSSLTSATPTLFGPRGGSNDIFLARFGATGQVQSVTFFGGSGDEMLGGLALDGSGNLYFALQTASSDLPVLNALQDHLSGTQDGALVSLNPTGTAIRFATYLGGSGFDGASGLAVDSAGHMVVTGVTQSADFPTASPLQASLHGTSDAYVARINFDGAHLSVAWSTFLGGSGNDDAYSAAFDPLGNVYLSGDTNSTDFPSVNPVQTGLKGSWDGFVSEIQANGSSLVYSSYLGGSSNSDWIYGLAVDGAGAAYVAGSTRSTDFPLVNALPPAQRGSGSLARCFVAKVAPLGGHFAYATTLAGSGSDEAKAVAVDPFGRALVSGSTASTDFPTLNAFQTALHGTNDAFVAMLAPAGNSLVFSSYYGGSGNGAEDAIATCFNGTDRAVIAGMTQSADLPLLNAAQTTAGGGLDGFLAYLDLSGSPPPGLAAYTITPQSGSVNTQVPFSLTGYAMAVGATVKLTAAGQPDIIAQSVHVAADGRSLTGLLDLAGQATGPRAVVVTNPNNDQATASLPFTIVGTGPQVNSVSPAQAYQGETVNLVIDGANFITGSTVRLTATGRATVTPSAVQMVSASQIRATFALPADGAGRWNVEVVEPQGSFATLTGGFTITSATLAVDRMDPARCGNHVRVPITIRGAGLRAGLTVRLVATGKPDITATGVQVAANGQSLTAWLDLRGQAAGLRDLVVTNPSGGPATVTGAFTVDDGGLQVATVWPTEAGADESLQVVIEGSSFGLGAGIRLTRSGQPSVVGTQVGLIGNTRLQANVALNNAAVGAWDVEAVGPLGEISSLPGAFHVVACRIGRISPVAVSNEVPFTVSMTGGGLATANRVTLAHGGTTVVGSNIHWDSQTKTLSAEFDMRPHPAGDWQLAVSRPDSATAVGADPINVLQGFVVHAADPAQVENCGLAAITLRGAGLRLSHVSLKRGDQTAWSGWVFADHAGTALALPELNLDDYVAGSYDVVVEPVAGNAITLTSALEVIAAPPRVTSVSPRSVLSVGFATMTLEGTSLGAGCTVKLARDGQADVTARAVDASGKARLTASFALQGIATGGWDLVVTRPDNVSLRLTGALTVTSAPAAALDTATRPDVQVALSPDRIRAGSLRAISATVTNRGGMDAGGTLCIAGLPADAQWHVTGPTLPAGAPSWDDLVTVKLTDQDRVLIVPRVRLRPGESVVYSVYVLVPSSRTFTVSAWWAGY